MTSHPVKCSFAILQVFLVLLVPTQRAAGQTIPVEGIRENTPTVHALTNVRIIQAPGKVVEKGTLVIRDGTIESVGSVTPPADAHVRDLKGMTLYPGLIDSYSDYGLPKAPEPGTDNPQREERKAPEPRGTGYWNSAVMAHQHADELFTPDAKKAKKLRELGFTSALIVPTEGIFKGTSTLVNLGDGKANEQIVQARVAHHIALERQRSRETYPGSLMGVIALIRQTLLDAEWYQEAQQAYNEDPKLTRPEFNETLAALQDVITRKRPIAIEASDELDFLRANNIAEEFSLKLIVRGSGHEYKRLDAVKATQRSIIHPMLQ